MGIGIGQRGVYREMITRSKRRFYFQTLGNGFGYIKGPELGAGIFQNLKVRKFLAESCQI